MAPSCDEVSLVDDTSRLAAADTDEDALVQPVEVGGRGLDLGGGAEGVFARVDVVAASEACKYLGAAVAHASCLHVEQGAVVGLQRVANVAEGGSVRQDDLPVRAGAGHQRPVE